MSEIAGAVIGVGIFLVVAREIYRSIHFLKEKEVKIIERLGRYHTTLTPVRAVLILRENTLTNKYKHRVFIL